MLADISIFESFCRNTEPCGESKDVSVANVNMSLSTLSQISGNTDLKYLVQELWRRKKLQSADAELDDVRIKSLDELVTGLQKLMKIKELPSAKAAAKTPPVVKAPASPTPTAPAPTAAKPTAPAAAVPTKVAPKAPAQSYQGPPVPFKVPEGTYALPKNASTEQWKQIEDALRWELGRTKDKEDKKKCKNTLYVVQYLREKQRASEGVNNAS